MVVYTGKTVKEAIQQASRSLHQPEAALKVEVLEQPRRGFLGIGRRPAKNDAGAATSNSCAGCRPG